MANSLLNPNNVILFARAYDKASIFHGLQGLPATLDMKTDDFMNAFVGMYQFDPAKKYRFVVSRVNGDFELPANVTLKEAGLRNGDALVLYSA